MLFNSLNFFAFLIVITTLYWSISVKYRWILLLIASYFFYAAWEPIYILLIVLSTGVDYFLSNYLISSNNNKKARWGLYTSIFMNLALLFSFKYYNFFQSTLQDTLMQIGIEYSYTTSNLLLPVGISFYTFQTMSYSIDVFKKKIQPERNFGKFALYVAFFTQLVAGPIERAKDLLPQLKNLSHHWNTDDFKDGMRLILFGLFQKVVVADNCAIWVDSYFNNYESHNGGTMLFAAYLFAIQLYTDFSGYSNIAIGSARLFGIKLRTNFRTPYFSSSLTSFWRKWHITLSEWMRDYVYIPLGGNRKGKLRSNINVLTTMTVSGLWHGASFNFLIWGFVNGVIIVIERVTGLAKMNRKGLFIRVLLVLITFHIYTLSLLFFRSSNFNQAISIFQKIFTLNPIDFYFICGDNKFTPAVIGSILLFLIELSFPFKPFDSIKRFNFWWRYLIYFVLIFNILLFGSSIGVPYIYFQF